MVERSMEDQARKLIDQILRPLIAMDGGRIELVRVVDKCVVIRLRGTCAGCPGRPYTLSGIIEPAVKRALGKDVRVEAEKE
jgi:Fe-S cluster biogenesis protein NfuA